VLREAAQQVFRNEVDTVHTATRQGGRSENLSASPIGCGRGLEKILCFLYNLAMPGSARGYTPAEYVIVFCMLLCGGGNTLEDIRVIKQDLGLRVVCGLNRFMSTDALGNWLRRTGEYGLPGYGSIVMIV
jgi:hypothetical protein